jgi:hypothetical protein
MRRAARRRALESRHGLGCGSERRRRVCISLPRPEAALRAVRFLSLPSLPTSVQRPSRHRVDCRARLRGAVTSTVTFSASPTAQLAPGFGGRGAPVLWAGLGVGVLALLRRRRLPVKGLAALMAAAGNLALGACGGSGSTNTQTQQSPSFTSTITITGTAGTTQPTIHTTTYSLTAQQ